jgi:uncharacterized protein
LAKFSGDVTFLLIIFFIVRGFIILHTEKFKMSGIYSIPLTGLKEGKHTYEFTIGDGFFETFEGSEIKRGEFKTYVELEKCSSNIELQIVIEGKAEVTCDRCLEKFDMALSSSNRLIIKQGSRWDDDDPDMVTIPLDAHEIDLGQYFYEYIHLALPIKRLHPNNNKGHSTCNPYMLRKLEDHLVTGSDQTDPRWEELKKLTKNN